LEGQEGKGLEAPGDGVGGARRVKGWRGQ
jgi:hypothetical protein